MRSKSIIAVALTATTLLASACSGGDDTSKNTAGTVKVLTIGYPDKDSLDPATGAKVAGINQLKQAFAKANPEIKLEIVNIPWGTGATGYAPKTEAMIKSGEACLYEMPAAQIYGRRGLLVNLDTMIAKDSGFKNVWGPQLDQSRSWGPANPKSLFFIPNNTGERVINWDSKIFQDYGVEPLSQQPTLAEIEEKAQKLTGTDPVTKKQTYGYWYQGKYAVWQLMAIAHAMGANWGSVKDDGKMVVNWNTPQYLSAVEWFIKMSKFAPKGALAGDGMPPGFLSDASTVAIIPEGEQGYFVPQLIASPNLRDRFRVSYNLRGKDGFGGVNTVSPLAMAANCNNKDTAWKALKWLAGAADAQRYYFESIGRIPVTTDGASVVPKLAELPDSKVILTQPQAAEAMYPWAADQPRWAMQTALEKALAGTITAKQALEQAQKETDDWLAKQETGK
jgi:multiple sugar transport system substrate-binding protein